METQVSRDYTKPVGIPDAKSTLFIVRLVRRVLATPQPSANTLLSSRTNPASVLSCAEVQPDGPWSSFLLQYCFVLVSCRVIFLLFFAQTKKVKLLS
jgi:hypothetical protein